MNEDALNDEISQMYGHEGTVRSLDSETLKAPISELKLPSPVVVGPETTVQSAIDRMMSEHTGGVVVAEAGKIVGIFTERDVLTRVAARGISTETQQIAGVMTPDPSTLTAHHMIAYALNFMYVGGYRHVPVVDDAGNAIGLVGVRDILKYLAAYFPTEVRNLPPPTQPEDLARDGG